MGNNSTKNNIKIYNRKTKLIENEVIFQEKYMNFFHENNLGRFLTHHILSKKWVSSLYGFYCQSSLSRLKIKSSIDNYDFSLDEIEKPINKYKNFNEFFSRKLKSESRPIDIKKDILVSPADSRLISKDIKNDLILNVKGFNYTLENLLKNKALADSFNNGMCLIFRLAPTDYHRYIYVDNGKHQNITNINGKYNSVHPISLNLNPRVFQENKRSYCVLNTENFDDILYMEVGAMFVGEIYNHFPDGAVFKKGDEKGFFKFGGSTIILLFKPNTITLDQDILENSKKGIETLVECGSKIASTKK